MSLADRSVRDLFYIWVGIVIVWGIVYWLMARLPLKPGRGVLAAYRLVREHVRPLGRDRTLHRDLEAVERLIRSGALLAAVEAVTGPLA